MVRKANRGGKILLYKAAMIEVDGVVPMDLLQITVIIELGASLHPLLKGTPCMANLVHQQAASTTLIVTTTAMSGDGVVVAAEAHQHLIEIGGELAMTKTATSMTGGIDEDEAVHLHRGGEVTTTTSTTEEVVGNLGEKDQDHLARTVAGVQPADVDGGAVRTHPLDAGNRDRAPEVVATAVDTTNLEISDGTVHLYRNPVSGDPNQRTDRGVAVDITTTTTIITMMMIRIAMMHLWRKIGNLRKVQSKTLETRFHHPSRRGGASARRSVKRRRRARQNTGHLDGIIARRAVIGAGVAKGNPISGVGKTTKRAATTKTREKEDLVDDSVAKALLEKIRNLPRKVRNIIVARVSESDVAMFHLAPIPKVPLNVRRKLCESRRPAGRRGSAHRMEKVDLLGAMTQSTPRRMLG